MKVINTYLHPDDTHEQRIKRGQALIQPIIDDMWSNPEERDRCFFFPRKDENGEPYFVNRRGERREMSARERDIYGV